MASTMTERQAIYRVWATRLYFGSFPFSMLTVFTHWTAPLYVAFVLILAAGWLYGRSTR